MPAPDYANAIGQIESGGDYGILGPQTSGGDRAYGKYQVMGNNVGPWTKEVLGVSLSPQEFLANPQAQDAVFNTKFNQSVAKYGNANDAASVWFTGKPLAEGANKSDGYNTGAQYVAKFNAAMAPPLGAPINIGSQPQQQQPVAGQPQQPQQQQAAAPLDPFRSTRPHCNS